MTTKSGVDAAQPRSETSAAPGISTSTEAAADTWPAVEVIEVIPAPRRRSAGARLADAAGDLKSRLSAIDFKQVKSTIPGFRGNPEPAVAEDVAAANEEAMDGAAAEQPAADTASTSGRLRELAAVSRSKLNSSLAQIAEGSAPMITKGQQVAERIAARVAIRADLAFLPKASKIKGAFRDVQGFVQRMVIDEPLAAGAQAAAWVDSHDPKGRFATVTSRMTAWHEERAGEVPADEPVTDAAPASTVEDSPRRRSRGTKPTGALKTATGKTTTGKTSTRNTATRKPATKEPRPSPEVQPEAPASATRKKASGAGSKAKPATARKKTPQISSEESVAESSTPVKRVRARTPGKATKAAAGRASESMTASASGSAPALEADTQQAANTDLAPVSGSKARPGAAKRPRKPQALSSEPAGQAPTTASPADAQTLRASIED
jgi:hypothetical protein